MKIAYPCPRCGEILLSNRCESCSYELMPETPKPKIEPKALPKRKRKGKGKPLLLV
jgi:hypothetical protein